CDKIIEAPREVFAEMCADYFGRPSQQLWVCGITGTNGKTTTALLLRNMLAQGGLQPGLITTVATQWPGHDEASERTTPDARTLQKTFRAMVDAGCRAAVMEVSSHAIDQARIGGTRFALTAFTNLTQDHLDYHQTMEAYFETKVAFFRHHPQVPAVINVDDPYGQRLFEMLKAEGHTRLYPYAASNIPATFSATGIDATIPLGERTISFHTALCGRYNLANLLCAATAAHALGVSADAILMAICEAQPQWGRLEPIVPHVFIDYAHTDDALTNVLSTLKECCKGRLICVFGCGGDRDKTKRPRMAAAVEALADIAIVTSDNPRTEDPQAIINDILPGFQTMQPIVEVDRREAIRRALSMREAEDILLIAGKGHEPYQEINGVKHPYSDAEAIRTVLMSYKNG
ncbi:MAG: UDP-N-acetylmuramoyl-L-alanyl-D-glutamate--2,6-diaminopimelate ligase, partial [bacterium]|nr:UDP-N-acetylmuramoyl-L-alanyl-D-glutamate--2,6-diaminopimelate ligase [bacterium]